MTDAQIGLSIATPVIVTFAIALFRMGSCGVVTAVLAIAIATSLFCRDRT